MLTVEKNRSVGRRFFFFFFRGHEGGQGPVERPSRVNFQGKRLEEST